MAVESNRDELDSSADRREFFFQTRRKENGRETRPFAIPPRTARLCSNNLTIQFLLDLYLHSMRRKEPSIKMISDAVCAKNAYKESPLSLRMTKASTWP